MIPEITLNHVRGEYIGYSRYGTVLHRELSKLGVEVYDRMDAPDDGNYHNFVIEQQGEDRRHKKTNVVAWVSVPTHARGWWDGQIPVLSTMWEATVIPESFRENLHAFDTVIVPSDQNVEIFSKYHPNVVKVPLGIDPDVWHYQPRQTPTDHFNFLIGGSGKRKGTDLAVRAFRAVFPDGSWGDGPEPRLILKSPKPEDFYGPRITRVGGRLSAEDEVSLYRSAHCYLQPSRGEGFGLQPLQAMAQGIPTILTDAHGHKDFAYLGMRLDSKLAKASYFIYGDAGEWWEPDFDQLCDYMRDVYNNYDAAAAKAEYRSQIVVRDYTWKLTAERFVGAIGLDKLTTPYAGAGRWVKPEAKRYKVIVNRAWAADIGGAQYQFTPGLTYWEPADVKRILFEQDLLAVDCLVMRSKEHPNGLLPSEDLGLAKEQCERLGEYTASHAHCQQCGQRLGSSPTRADEIFEQLQRVAELGENVATLCGVVDADTSLLDLR